MTATNASRGRASRAHALLHQAVLARTSSAWVHGQVVATRGANIVVQSGEDDASTCRATSAIVIDPVTALLLGQCRFPVRTPLEEMQAIHASILGRLLGDDSRPRQTPTRNIVRILDRLVEPENIPTGNRSCVWISPEDSASHHFPLQHAIDFVFVHESCARRIPKSVRDGIGATFFSPPDSHGQSTARAQLSQPSPVARASSPPSRGTKRPAPSDSFYDSASDEDASCVAHAPTPGPSRDHVVSRDDADRHARIVASLAHDPELLDHYLSVRARQQPSPKRHHVALAGDGSKADKRTSKFQFLPTSTQEKIFEITMAPLPPGTSAHDFLDSLIAHHAVQFPPHPGVLLRLFALDFGTRGLSVMNMTRLNHLAKIEWVHSSSVNMQNFSAAVGVPSPAVPACIEDVIGAISTLCTYFAAFAAPATVAFGQSLLAFVQQLVGLELWGPLDLKYLVIWTNGRLEHFRNCAARDANDGGASRLHAVETLCQTHPEFQMIVQLITSQRVAQALQTSHAAGASRGTTAATPYGPQERWFRPPDGPRGPRRGGDASSQRARMPQEVIQLIPRQGGKSLCLKSLSQTGCSGARGNPSECFDSNRRHFLPVTLPAPVRDYINANYGGLRAEAQHL